MPRRPPSRWLAPLAVAAVAAAGYGVVISNRGGSTSGGPAGDTGGGARTTKRTTTRSTSTTGTKGTTGATGARTYTVRSGDTLSSISLETGVPLSRLNQLNPRLDAQTLQPGQRITLRP
jgi:LysM repeat protein